MSRNQSLKETGSSKDQKFAFSDNLSQNIWQRIENYNKTGQVKKFLIYTLACFWTAMAKPSFLERRFDTRLCLRPKLVILLIIPYFLGPKSYVVRQLVRQLVY